MSPQDIEPATLRATGPVHPLDVTFIDEEDLATPCKRRATDRHHPGMQREPRYLAHLLTEGVRDRLPAPI